MRCLPACIAAAGFLALIAPSGGSSAMHPGVKGQEGGWLRGYARTIAGEVMGYHSSYPDATSALLVRATDGTMSIEWETESVPPGFSAPEATFIWLCGMGSQKGAHRFDLAIDGRPAFSFRSAKDAGDKAWDLDGRGGARLSFRAAMVDQFGELFGFMTLRLPRADVHPGRPLRLKVTGENGGSRDWHMVFRYELKPFVQASAVSALLKDESGGGTRQLVRVAISRIGPPVQAGIRIDGALVRTVGLETGYNAVYLPVEAVAEPRRASVEVLTEAGPPARLEVELRPVTPRTLYILPHSHTDIGYSSHQIKVEADHLAYIDQAVELARKTASYPEGARFKWNTEVFWAVESYMRRASEERKAAFLQAVRSGAIEVQALLANELTGVCHPEELFELTADARRFAGRYGLAVETAAITDIPSYSWPIVTALGQAGVKYFSSGPNYMPTHPDGGDRIGGALRAWGDKPFYWISPSGREKVLFWMAGRGYSWFHGLNMGQLTEEKSQRIYDYCRELEDRAYPYEMVQVRYTIGGDNGPPDPALPDIVRRWNERHVSPQLAIATAAEMFRALEKSHGAELPRVRGDFTPYWEDGAGSTARETAMNRRSVVRLLQAEALWAMLDPEGWPEAAFQEAWRQALLWDEHTWGAADSVSDPDGENARSQWAHKQAFALEADKRSRQLLAGALKRTGEGGEKTGSNPARRFGVFNTLSWARSGVAVAPAEMTGRGERVVDAAGRPVASQRLKDGSLAVLASDLPAFGAGSYTAVEGTPQPPPAAAAATAALEPGGDRVGAILRNDKIEARIDATTGAISSLRWLERGGAELVDATARPGLNAYHYVPGLDPDRALGPGPGRISIDEGGPLVAAVAVDSPAPGSRKLRREYRLAAGSSRLEIINRLDKALVRDKEAVHFGFPFRVPGGTLRFDLGWGWIDPAADVIAGSCLDFFCPQSAADVSNGEWGVAWVTLDAPLAEAGAMTDESRDERGGRVWRTSLDPTQTVYSYAMNNYWHTNYKADQEGWVELRYAVEPHEGGGPEAVKRIGLEAEQSLLVAGAPPRAEGRGPLFPLTLPAGVVATSLRPAAGERSWLIRVYNASEKAVEAEWSLPDGARAFLSDPDGARGRILAGRLSLAPFETARIMLKKIKNN